MLEELRIENLLLLDEAQLRLAPGLNVVTGETGAGKTLLAGALDLLLGGRARRGIVRPGAAEAYVEGVFTVPPQLVGREPLPEGASEIVLARRVWPDGRTRAYVCGRSSTAEQLRELGSALLCFYGQHEHRKLMLSAAQLEILDARCGPAQLRSLAAAAAAHARLRHAEDRVRELGELAGARERELDLLSFELAEIESAAPTQEEKEELTDRRERLRHLGSLRAAAAGALESVDAEGTGAGERLSGAVRQLDGVAAVDPALLPLRERLEAVRIECDDLVAELRAYVLSLESSGEGDDEIPLQEVEERLALLSRLERKHGGSLGDVLAHARRCRDRIDELQHADTALRDAERELAGARTELGECCGEMHRRRSRAAPALAGAVKERLAELAMPDAQFEVRVSPRNEGPGPRGSDAVELMIATNSGVPIGPLRQIASGGELSRIMLALLSVAHGALEGAGSSDDMPLLVFDEIDAGIGGHTAHAVGEHLRTLARGRQLLCITHLPQVAALADRHFTIVKDRTASPARTTVTALGDDGVVGELVRMLGAGEGDRAASEHARQLLRAA